MAKTKTVEYTLSLDDLASSVYQKFVTAVQSGEVDISKAIKGSSGAFDEHGKSVQNLTQWIRDQRTEQRQQNFLFRESQQAIGAVALGLSLFSTAADNSNESVKVLSGALSQGFLTFQGLSFALTAVPYGNVAAGIAGIATAVLKLGQDAGKASEEGIKKFSDSLKDIGQEDWGAFAHNAETSIKTIQDKINELWLSNTTQVKAASGEMKRAWNVGTEGIRAQIAELENEKSITQGFLKDFKEREEKQKIYNDLTAVGTDLVGKTDEGLLAQIDAQQKVRKEILLTLTDSQQILELQRQIAAVDEYRKQLIEGQNQAKSLAELNAQLAQYTTEFEKTAPYTQRWQELNGKIHDTKVAINDLNTPPKSSFIFTFGYELQKSFDAGKESVKQFKDSMKALFGSGPSEEVRIQLRIEADISSMERSLMTETELIDEWEQSVVNSADATEEQKTRAVQIAAKRRAQIELQMAKQTFSQIADIASRAVGILGKFSSQETEARIIDIQTQRDAALAAIDEQLNAENLSDEQRKVLMEQRATLQSKYDAAERSAKQQQFEAEKSAAIIQSIIQTALAVVEALPNIPLAIAVGVLGAAETALIASQPTPKFHEGSGGPVFFDAPTSKNFPIVVRGGETFEVRTETQRSSSGINLTININSPIPGGTWVVQSIKKALRDTGVSVDKLLVNNRSGVALG